MALQVRPPAVAGQFYPSQANVLLRDIRQYTSVPGEKLSALGCVVPHAGYMYSGHVAGAVYGRLGLPKRFVVLCPNHTGTGAPLGMMSDGIWTTPLGDARIDEQLARELRQQFPGLTDEADSQRHEHAVEVQIPFLQVLAGEFTFVPITVGISRFDVLEQLGTAIARTAEAVGERIMIVASSDMNHYESDSVTRIKDRKAIDRMLALDALGLYETVVNEKISMCGFGPAVATITAARQLGARSAELIKYATSADVSGEKDWCVGYAGIVIT